jgi:excisionase family DNA binding protein
MPQAHRDSDSDSCHLTIPEVAKRLHLGETSIFKLLKSGKLPSVKIGRSRRIAPEALAQFLAESNVAAVAAVDEAKQVRGAA